MAFLDGGTMGVAQPTTVPGMLSDDRLFASHHVKHPRLG